MAKRLFKRGASGLLAALLVFTGMPLQADTVKAEEPTVVVEIEQDKIGGLKEMEVTQEPAIRLEEGESPEWSNDRSVASDAWTTGENASWAEYGSYYFYNQMTEPERAFYDQLMAACLTNVNGGADITPTNGNYCLEKVQSTNAGNVFSQDTMVKVFYLFRYENPQFYYLMNGYSWGYSYSGDESVEANRHYYIKPKVYPSFATGTARATAASTLTSAVQTYINAANEVSGDEAKIRKIHDMLTENVVYNHDAAGGVQQETDSYSQSVYSTFTKAAKPSGVKCTTVCAGYAGGFAMLCNKLGIDSIVITSSGHAWNRVEIDDVWYTIDCTWDDTDQKRNVRIGEGVVVECTISNNMRYDYYLRSDAKLKSLDDGGAHNEEAIMTGLPKCTQDCEPSGESVTATNGGNNYTITLNIVPGVPETITAVTETPTMTKSEVDPTHYTITLSSETGASIYYTTDGTVPKVGQGRSIKYTDPFTATNEKVIKAIAVIDPKKASSVLTRTVSNPIHTISYELNGGTAGGDYPANYEESTSQQTITLADPTKEGYTFSGWTIAPEVGATYSAGTLTIPDEYTQDITLTAGWTPTEYTINYDLAGGSVGSANPTTYNITTETFSLNNPTKENYTFVGWTGSNGATPQTEVSVTKGTTGNLTFTAVWVAAERGITYNLSGGTAGGTYPATYSYNENAQNIALAAPTKTGYTFSGWTISPANATYNDGILTINEGCNETLALTAGWTPDNYTISYTLGDGTDSPSNPTTYTVETETITLINPTKTGYSFVGWTGTGITTPQTTVKIEKGSTGNKSYTANWQIENYNITYNLDGGTLQTANPTSYTISTASFTLNNPTKTGYTFTGWSGTGLGSNSTEVTIASGSTGHRSYTANWTPNVCTVKYNKNAEAASGSVSNQSVKYNDEEAVANNNGFTYTGYTFAGWNTSEGGNGTAVAAGASILALSKAKIGAGNGELNLYAQWTANPATAPTINTQPVATSCEYKAASGHTLTVAATAEAGHTLSYQWYSNTQNSTAGATAIDGATSASYDYPVDAIGTTYYYCVVTATMTANSETATTTSDIVAGTVTKAKVTVNGFTASNKVYDGGTTATLVNSNLIFGGIKDGDTLTATATGAFDSKDVGNGKTVTISNITLGGTSIAKYELALDGNQDTTTANITAKPVTITGVSASDKVYNGNTVATVTGTPTISGLVTGDEVTVNAGTAAFADKNVGTGKEVTFTGFNLTGVNVDNYSLSAQPASVTASITKANLTVAAKAYTIDVNGVIPAINTSEAYTVTGLATGDAISAVALTYDPANPDNTKSGSYVIKVGNITFGDGSSADNYNITKTDGSLVIGTSCTITATPNNESYGSVTGARAYAVGETVTLTATATDSDYVFSCWKKGDDVVSSDATYTFEASEDVTITAEFVIKTYTVTFDPDGGSTVPSQVVNVKGLVVKPTDPTKSGYTFGGWYKESALTTAWNFASDKVTANVTLFAKWTKNGSRPSSSSSDNNSGGGSTDNTSGNNGNSDNSSQSGGGGGGAAGGGGSSDKTSTTTNPDGSKTQTTETTKPDGSKTTTETTTNTDGSTSETKTSTSADGNTSTSTTVEKDASGKTTATTETKTTTTEDKSTGAVETKTEETATYSDGNKMVTESTETKNADGSSTMNSTSTVTDASGALVSETVTEKSTSADGTTKTNITSTAADGSSIVISSTTKSDGSGSMVTTDKNEAGKATEISTATFDKKGETKEEASYKVSGNTVKLADLATKGKTATVPDKVKDAEGKNYKVVELTKGALSDNTKITKATIGKNVTKIGDKAFGGDTKLATITFKGTIKSVSPKAFKDCKSLKKISVPNKASAKKVTAALKSSLGAKAAEKYHMKKKKETKEYFISKKH